MWNELLTIQAYLVLSTRSEMEKVKKQIDNSRLNQTLLPEKFRYTFYSRQNELLSQSPIWKKNNNNNSPPLLRNEPGPKSHDTMTELPYLLII